ncbi:MAG: ECF-type sigma factor [Planctomycetota bacterium]
MTEPRDEAPPESCITALLHKMSRGDRDATNAVYSFMFRELQVRADRALRRSAQPTLHVADLISLAYERIARLGGKDWHDRHHFLAVAATAMRCALVDHARRPRLPEAQEPVEGLQVEVEGSLLDVIGFEEGRQHLEGVDPILARAVELRAMGMNMVETAGALGISTKTLSRKWPKVRAVLERFLR